MENSLIATGDWSTFLSLKEEKLLLAIRKHPFVLISPITILTLLTIMFIGSAYIMFQHLFISLPLFIATSLLFISLTVGVVTKFIIDWYFHVYILTNRKILEFCYTPLTSYNVNDVMLDRVFCTEVDTQTNGWLHDLIDMGDVIITFDRPTHQQDFIISDIQGCHKIGNFLTEQLLESSSKEAIHPIWFPGHNWGQR